MEQLKPHPAYKDSGVPWLGQVPAHWSVRRIKSLFREKDERSGRRDGFLLSLTRTRGIVPQTEASNRIATVEDLSKYKVCRPGDLIMNRMQAWSGMFAVSTHEGVVSPDYSVFNAMGDATVEFFEYLFKTPLLVDQFAQRSKGIGTGFNRLYTPDFGAVPAIVPPLQEQRAIVRYLDHIDRRINRYIRGKRKLSALLNEQKQAIIHRAVTRGLDPEVPLKPSGVEWLGEIPAHWEVVALKRVLRQLIDCEHKTAPAVDASPYRVIRTSAVRNGQLRLEGTFFTSRDGFLEWTKRGLPEPGDVIFTREAPAGEACVVPDGLQVCLGQRTVLMKLDKAKYDPAFLVHMIYGGPPRDIITVASQGSTVDHFNMEDIATLTVFVPPLEEQLQIVDWLDSATCNLDTAIQKAAAEIDLIREYRTRLIADVVTGKLDVRGVALPEDGEAGEAEWFDEMLDEEGFDAEGAEDGDE